MKIVDIRCVVEPYSSATWLDELQVASPMAAFPRFRGPRSLWRGPGADALRVFVLTDEGVVGAGEGRGGAVTQAIVSGHLRPLLIGVDPRDVELRWEEMQGPGKVVEPSCIRTDSEGSGATRRFVA